MELGVVLVILSVLDADCLDSVFCVQSFHFPAVRPMNQHRASENDLYLVLFASSSGGG
jgi:hypothetical protein